MTTLALPAPALDKGRFASIEAYTDEGLYRATGIRVAFTTRTGGVSEGPFASLNLGSHVGDDARAVARNRMLVQEAFSCADDPLIVPNQVHGDVVLAVKAADDVDAVQAQAEAGADGLIVDADRVAVLLCFADCVPVIVASPTGRFAVVHAGWRGVDNLISVKAIELMADADADVLGCSPAQAASLYNVYLGPHIAKECFETGPDVRARFERFGEACLYGASNVDLAVALHAQLVQAHVRPERIAEVGKCTVCANDEFFSYRAQRGRAGRHAAFAVRATASSAAAHAH